jgi:hypothetical protein
MLGKRACSGGPNRIASAFRTVAISFLLVAGNTGPHLPSDLDTPVDIQLVRLQGRHIRFLDYVPNVPILDGSI